MVSDRRYAPDLRIELVFPTLHPDKKVPLSSVEIKREDRGLDSAVFLVHSRFFDDVGWGQYLRTGLPVHITWRALGQSGSFYGYLYLKESEDLSQVQLTAIGPGYRLLGRHGHAIASGSFPNVVRTVCSSHQLAFTVAKKRDTKLNTVQGDQTDWEWLKAVTLESGWSCHFRGTTFVAHDLDNVRDFSPVPPVEVILPNKGIFQRTPDSAFQVRSFVTKRANTAGGAMKGPPRYATMTLAGDVAYAGGAGDTAQFTSQPVMSPMDAMTSVTQHQYDTRWPERATLIMDNNTRLAPLDTVRTWNQRREMLDVWSVLSITTKLGNHDAVMECELGRETSSLLYDRAPREYEESNWRAVSYLGSESWYSEPVLKISPRSKDAGKYSWSSQVVHV